MKNFILLKLFLLTYAIINLSACSKYISTSTLNTEKVIGSDKLMQTAYEVKLTKKPSSNDLTFKAICNKTEKYKYATQMKKKHTYKKFRPIKLTLNYAGATALTAGSFSLMKWEDSNEDKDGMQFSAGDSFLFGGGILGLFWLYKSITNDFREDVYKYEITPGPDKYYNKNAKPLANSSIIIKSNNVRNKYTTDYLGNCMANVKDFNLSKFDNPTDVNFSFQTGEYNFDNKISINSELWTIPYVKINSPKTQLFSNYKTGEKLVTGVKDMEFKLLSSDYRNNWYKIDYNGKTAWLKADDTKKYYSIPKKIENKINYVPVIQDYVGEKINTWQEKGEFERTSDYLIRVNKEKRNQAIKEYTNEAINYYGKEQINLSNNTIDRYDPDNETYKINFDNQTDIYVAVPIDEAPHFKEKWNKVKITNPDYGLTNEGFVLNSLDIKLRINDTLINTYNASSDLAYGDNVEFTFNFDEIKIDPTKVNRNKNNTKLIVVGKSDVDMNIPVDSLKVRDNIFALVIGNEDYSSFQTDLSSEVNVDYAENDARIFHKYLVNTIGIPEKNILLKINATYGQMKQSLAWIDKLAELSDGNAELIFYYSGHGLPDEKSKEGYIMPVDISGANIQSAIKVADVYNQLAEHQSKKVTVFLDACFSGGARNQGLVAMKGVKIKPKEERVSPNMVVFSSSSGDEASTVYREKQHGLFTYYLLKKLQETNGDVTYKELSDYISQKVKLESVLTNNKLQSPQTITNKSINDKWKVWSIK